MFSVVLCLLSFIVKRQAICSVKEANNLACDYHRYNLIAMHFIRNVWENRMCPSWCKGKRMFFNLFGLLGQILSGSPA